MNNKNSREISSKKTLISAFFVHGIVEIPYFIFPVIIVLIEKDLSKNLGEFTWLGLGSIGTVAALASGLPSPIFGWLADRYRCGLMMTVSLILGSFGAFVVGLWGKNFSLLLIGIAFTGLGNSLYHPPGLSFVSEAFIDPESQRYSSKYNRILGIHGVGGTIGASTGPLSVFFFIEFFSFDWQQIYLIWSPFLILIALIFWISVARYEPKVELLSQTDQKLDNSEGNRENTKVIGNIKSLYIVFIFMFAMSLTWGMISFILAPILTEYKDFSVSMAALFVGSSHLIAASGQLAGGVMGDKYSEKIALSFAASLQLGIIIGIFHLDVYIVLFLLYILLRIVNSMFWPLTNSLLAKSSTHRGSAFGWFMLIVNTVRAVGPSVDGLIISFAPNSYFWIFTIASIFSLLAIISMQFVKNPDVTASTQS
ncbi:MAG: MFS transporter [Candidatus Hodarchaeota archaeon]